MDVYRAFSASKVDGALDSFNMTKKATQLSGAQAARDSILKFVRRRIKAVTNKEYCGICLNELKTVERFIMGAVVRFNAKPGGLGKKPKKVKADFDALGIP